MHTGGKQIHGSPLDSGFSSSCVKVYLCSNPEDSVVERRALRETVFPRFREHCRHSLGLDVRVIDPFESSDPSLWPDEDTRQQIIQECRRSSAGPFLLALVGHQYGAARLPAQVEVSEFELLLQQCQEAGISTQELEKAYQRDENTIPTSYCLRASHRHTWFSLQATTKKKEESKNEAKDEELRKLFHTAVSLCVQSGSMTPERAKSYYRSALDVDLRYALESCPEGDMARRCLIYIHKIINAKREGEKGHVKKQLQSKLKDGTPLSALSTNEKLLSELCDSFLNHLITSCQLLVYTLSTVCDQRHGYTSARRRGYVESLCQQVYCDLLQTCVSLNVSQSGEPSPLGDALSREQAEQEQLCDILSQFYDIIQPEEEKVRVYVETRYQQFPLIVTGGPCTGKTVLLAHCTQQMKSWLADSDPVVISFFCSLSINASPKHLLSSLCYQIACRYHSDSSAKQDASLCTDLDDSGSTTNPREFTSSCSPASVSDSQHEHGTKECVSDCDQSCNLVEYPGQRQIDSGIIKPDACLSELKQHLSSLISHLPSTEKPLILILDGLDQLKNNTGLQIMESLPSPLPPCLKFILTVSSNRTHFLQAIKLHYASHIVSEDIWTGHVCVQLGPVDRKQSVQMLASLLKRSGRRVTSGQQALVNQALTRCCLPLYTRLLHAHTSLWHSDSDVIESSLPDAVHSSISVLLDHLEQKHFSSIVARAVSYLTLSRTGLSEAELADLLSSSEDSQHMGCSFKMKVPQVDVERLLLDLKSFLIKRKVANSQVLFWVSRHFKLVVAKRYLGTHDVRIHSEMADYFSGETSGVNKDAALKTYTDTQQSSQPFVFTSIKGDSRVNVRKILELPYHLQQSGRWKEFERVLLMSFEFHQAMVQAGLLGELLTMLETDKGSSQFKFATERQLLASILKSSACFLQSSPLQLPTVMETSLLPYLEVFPALEGYVRDIREGRESGLGITLCPSAPSVPHIQYLNHDNPNKDVCVREIAGTECGAVAEIMDDGSAWIWKGRGYNVANLSLSCEQTELKFAGVKGSGSFLLLSTRCNRFFVWDAAGPEKFLEVKDPFKNEHESSQAPGNIEGFVASQKTLSMWWKDESFVSVFDISSETLTHFQCQSRVACVVFSSDGLFMYCGQEEGMVSIFDMKMNSLLSTCSNSNHSAVTVIILCEDKREMACVDRTGNVALWDVAANAQPPRLVKESFSQAYSNNILTTNYSSEINTLLLCQAHQTSLWDTCTWELWDQFLAPQGRAFSQAVLSHDGHLFLALLDTCTFVLVWRVSSGQCVLSLETNKQPHTLLKMASDVISVSHDGCLTAWDSEMIDCAGGAQKMGRGVKEVVVEQAGEWFYTRDGSEQVWRWSLETGLPHVNFLHAGPVEKLQLSPNGVHLVSLSAGDIYVWRTETGENVLRISGSRATDILITPNNNFGVSISQRGLSRVWKIAQGNIVCSIHPYLSDPQVSPESTYLLGCRHGDLLAASLWSGSISKRFFCVESSEQVVAFHTLSEHPEFVVVMVASGAVYTWKVAEETVCQHFELPHMFHCQPQDFQMSSDGSYALLSTENDAINLLNLSRVRLCSFKVEGPVIKACLDKTGHYVAYITSPSRLGDSCDCSLHARPILQVRRLSDGEKIGAVCLSKNPLTLVICEQHCVFVGFGDGSVGVYCISDATVNEDESVRYCENWNVPLKQCPFDREPFSLPPQATPNIMWP
ncbi:NACHT and WD repeat domain-containing protein 2 [Archocentrus centrarchus]|uniref:NACHT and WD repeat domain-containing protein 2 n=1 Tax=Archocentrus centrarchus TaxID=63155 RepID=UPI0011EA388B|nr:NACHT and WD repeat domain-containing protein 2-like [Archocentrus centrarchus]